MPPAPKPRFQGLKPVIKVTPQVSTRFDQLKRFLEDEKVRQVTQSEVVEYLLDFREAILSLNEQAGR